MSTLFIQHHFILILGCSTTAFAAETHNYDTENLPHDGADYFETEIKADEENEERISDFVTVYGYQYTKGMILSILVDTFISKISFPMQPGPEIGSISDA